MSLAHSLLSKPVRAKAVARMAASSAGMKFPKMAQAGVWASRHPVITGLSGAGFVASLNGGMRDPDTRRMGRVNYHGGRGSSAVSGLQGRSSGGFTG